MANTHYDYSDSLISGTQFKAINSDSLFEKELPVTNLTTITTASKATDYGKTALLAIPENDQLDVHNIWGRPIEEHEQEIGTALYPEEELAEYIVTFPADSGVSPLYLVFNKPSGDIKYIPAPRGNPPLPAFPDAIKAKKKTAVQGGGKLRERWKDRKGRIYEWDSQHGKVEVYTKNGKHLGEFDHITGEQTKDADPSRKVEK